MAKPLELTIHLPQPHRRQLDFIQSPAKRKIIRAGRRGGKTVGAAIIAVEAFLAKRRVLYATPTADQIGRFWHEVTTALAEPIAAKIFNKNETEHSIEVPGTLNRIRAKTAWNADTLRGDFADLLILDEFQLMNEDAWSVVGAPMLLDNNGDAIFIYTPPSTRTLGASKAQDKLHAAKLFKQAQADTSGRWQAFHFSSHDNPVLSADALAEITRDMSRLAYEQEILALDKDDNPAALWTRAAIENLRVTTMPTLNRIVIAIDPSATGTENSDEAGIIAAGLGVDGHGYVLEDASVRASPATWAARAVALYNKYHATDLVAESNQGGDMVALTIGTIKGAPRVKLIHASQGKAARAHPIAAQYAPVDEHGKPLPGRVHHVGAFSELEDELCTWVPGSKSPNRLDALVYALSELMLAGGGWTRGMGK